MAIRSALTALVILLFCGTAAMPVAKASTAMPQCDLACVARELGWQLHALPANETLQIEGGRPCTRGSLREAQQAGDLRAGLPEGIDAQTRTRYLQALLDDPASRCAFGFKLGEATRIATGRLVDNRGYRFSALQLGWIGFGLGGAKRQGWQRFRSFGRGYQPAGSNARAIKAFYDGHVRSECGVGRQVAQLATLRELFGAQAFDTSFTSGELSIGTFLTLHRTDSILLGHHAGPLFADGKARKTIALGRQAFMGVPGFIEHVFPKAYLDDIHNQAENFVVTDVSPAAAEALLKHGGFAHYDALNRKIWELARSMRAENLPRFERLVYDNQPSLREALDDRQRATLQQLRTLLDEPFYQGFMIYVHRQGIRPVGYHIVRLLDRNPRTPYAIDLAMHNLHSTIYQRWIQSQRDQCACGAGPQQQGP